MKIEKNTVDRACLGCLALSAIILIASCVVGERGGILPSLLDPCAGPSIEVQL